MLYCLDCGLCLVPVVPPPRRFVLYCLECAARWARLQADDGKVWVLFDLSGENGKKEEMAEIMQRHTRARARAPSSLRAGLALRNLDAGALRASFRLLAEHYPERLAGCFM